MGNQHSATHTSHKPRKNVHWKSAGRPTAPGRPEILPILSDDEPNAITLRWAPSLHDGGAALHGYQVECKRLGAREWIRTSPSIVQRPELILTGLDPPHRYQFRVAAINAIGRSEYSELSDVLNISSDRIYQPPQFLQRLEDTTALENETSEFRVTFIGSPIPVIAWFKDDYEIFSSRRTAIATNDNSSVLVFHQAQATDEGEIKCTATNRAGHAVVKAKFLIEATPKLRYPRQYEDGLLFEVNETVYLKTVVVGKPIPEVEWLHNGQPIVPDMRVEILNTPTSSALKIHSACRNDRGEYQITAKNKIGEDMAAFLVTITAPPDAPKNVFVTRQVDKSVALDWEPPEDDGGCRIGNYVIEYYRTGWNVWLKATTSRKTNITLFDLIEGSEYKFRVKAESPYGMSAPSVESAPVKIPGRAVDMEFIALEARIINKVKTDEGGKNSLLSPIPRRKRVQASSSTEPEIRKRRPNSSPVRGPTGSNEFMLVLYPDRESSVEKAEKRKSFQLDLEDALSPPPISLSAPDLSSRNIFPFKSLRNAVSSTELLHERAMARFYKAVALKEEQSLKNDTKKINTSREENHNIPRSSETQFSEKNEYFNTRLSPSPKKPETSINENYTEVNIDESNKISDSETTSHKWHSMSFDEDYTASTISTDCDYSEVDEISINEDNQNDVDYLNEQEKSYNPRDKKPHLFAAKNSEEESIDINLLKPLPDPNFVPKPILKKRYPEISNIDQNMTRQRSKNSKQSITNKDEKINIFKRITKMPVHKPFSLPKLLNKKEPDKNENITTEKVVDIAKKLDIVEDKLNEEGRTVIDYYTKIVKEYGTPKKPVTPIYLSTEDLKSAAEKQQVKLNKRDELVIKDNSTKIRKKMQTNRESVTHNSILTRKHPNELKSKLNKRPLSPKLKEEKSEKNKKEVMLQSTERATIIIPINYQELEKQAKITVRSAIDYTIDICLLLLAFWVYFFKDEKLSIPLLLLIIYRQLQESIMSNMPQWIRRSFQNYFDTKTS